MCWGLQHAGAGAYCWTLRARKFHVASDWSIFLGWLVTFARIETSRIDGRRLDPFLSLPHHVTAVILTTPVAQGCRKTCFKN